MWPFTQKVIKSAIETRTDADDSRIKWLREVAERQAILEGEMSGLKLAVESLAESFQKHLAKMASRARREAAEPASDDGGGNIDPRIAALRRRRHG